MMRMMIWPEQYFPLLLLALVCMMYSFLYSRPTHSGLPCFCSYVFVRSICCLVGFTCIFVLSMRFSGNLNTQWGTISHKGNVATVPTTEFKPQRSFNLHIHTSTLFNSTSQKSCTLYVSPITDSKKITDHLYRYHHASQRMPSTTRPRNVLGHVGYQSHLQKVNIVRVGGKFRLKEQIGSGSFGS